MRRPPPGGRAGVAVRRRIPAPSPRKVYCHTQSYQPVRLPEKLSLYQVTNPSRSDAIDCSCLVICSRIGRSPVEGLSIRVRLSSTSARPSARGRAPCRSGPRSTETPDQPRDVARGALASMASGPAARATKGWKDPRSGQPGAPGWPAGQVAEIVTRDLRGLIVPLIDAALEIVGKPRR